MPAPPSVNMICVKAIGQITSIRGIQGGWIPETSASALTFGLTFDLTFDLTFLGGLRISRAMTIRDILIAPDPRLKVKSRPVEAVDDALRVLMDDMMETMHDAPGIGLAAVQIGIARAVIVMDLAKEDEPPEPLFFVNPKIIWSSDELQLREEGCLSLPEYYEDVVRPDEVRVRFLDYDGEARELHCKDMLAVCIQHEIDHLDGVLFVDHLTRLKRQMILRKLSKTKKQLAAENV